MTHTITMKRDSLMSSGKKNKGHYFEKKPKTSWLVSMYRRCLYDSRFWVRGAEVVEFQEDSQIWPPEANFLALWVMGAIENVKNLEWHTLSQWKEIHWCPQVNQLKRNQELTLAGWYQFRRRCLYDSWFWVRGAEVVAVFRFEQSGSFLSTLDSWKANFG